MTTNNNDKKTTRDFIEVASPTSRQADYNHFLKF